MTDGERRKGLLEFIRVYTSANTASKALAKRALIETGIYTKKGTLRVEFGGPSKTKDAA
jgi:hypothetical protein